VEELPTVPEETQTAPVACPPVEDVLGVAPGIAVDHVTRHNMSFEDVLRANENSADAPTSEVNAPRRVADERAYSEYHLPLHNPAPSEHHYDAWRPSPPHEEDVRREEAEAPVPPPPPPAEEPTPAPRDEERMRDQMFEKQSTLYDLNQLESRGVRLSRKWTMDDSLEEMTHELRHHLLVLDERENVGMMKNGLKMALTGLEILNTRFNLLDLEGWSAQAATELDKQDGNLSRIYRKYWRRSTSNNPESEIAFSLVSSMGMYHMKRSMARQMMNRNSHPTGGRRRGRSQQPVDDDSSDDERPPR